MLLWVEYAPTGFFKCSVVERTCGEKITGVQGVIFTAVSETALIDAAGNIVGFSADHYGAPRQAREKFSVGGTNGFSNSNNVVANTYCSHNGPNFGFEILDLFTTGVGQIKSANSTDIRAAFSDVGQDRFKGILWEVP